MNPTQLPLLVEGILILIAGTFGFILGRAGRPYGKVKLAVHLFFVLWFAVGYGFIAYAILTKGSATMGILVPVTVMGLAILTQLVTGILMLASKKAEKAIPKIHIVSASLLVASDICAFFMAGLRP
jgi:heme A synthase